MITITSGIRESPAGARHRADGRRHRQRFSARRGSYDSDDRRKHRRSPAATGDRSGTARRPGASEPPAWPRASSLLALQDARGLVEGRARDQRDHGRRGPAAAPVPRHPRASRRRGAAHWIRSQQREDGTWANFYGGPGDLSTTVEAYVALRLAGDPPTRRTWRGRARVGSATRAASSATRVFTRIWLALFGLWSWDDLPALPPELISFPVVAAQHLRLRLLGAADDRPADGRLGAAPGAARCRSPLDELRTGAAADPAQAASARASWDGAFQRLDRALHALRARRSRRCAPGASARPSGGSSSGRRPTAAGAASSRRGCTR